MTYPLATVFPFLQRVRLPLSRDQFVLIMAAINQFFLGLDIYLAHNISGTIVPREWIPIIFGPIAGVTLVVAGLIALRNRPLATWLATITFITSIMVGLLGAYFHLVRGSLPSGPVGQQVSVDLLIWAPPVIGPLFFSLIGWMGISAAWIEDPIDSGTLTLFANQRLSLPYSKTRGYLFLVSLGTLATLISSVLDHARTPFDNPWVWIPLGVGVFATVVAGGLGAIDNPSRTDLTVYVFAMVLLIVVGLVGLGLHVGENLTSDGLVINERFIRGAPFLAPTLFSNMGALGLLVLLDPRETRD